MERRNRYDGGQEGLPSELSDLHFSVRTSKFLLVSGIRTILQLMLKSDIDLEMCFGRVAADEIIDKLEELGLRQISRSCVN